MIVISRANFYKTIVASFFLTRSEEQEKVQLYPAAQFIRNEVKVSIANNPALAGSILRLAFHDAVVRSNTYNPYIGGADGEYFITYIIFCSRGSELILFILGSIRYELGWNENRGLSKPLKEIEKIYESQFYNCNVENDKTICNTLSFADVLALAGAAAVEASHGPNIPIKLGRIDVAQPDERYLDRKIESESDRSSITTSLPSPGLDSLGLRNFFMRIGLTEEEMVALMGAHDLGRHVTLTGMPKDCLRNLTRICLEEAPTLAPFITKDPDTFSNTYFKTLLRWNDREIEFGEAAFIPTDVALVVDEGLKKYVLMFSRDEKHFFRTFSQAYQKLVDSTAKTSLRY